MYSIANNTKRNVGMSNQGNNDEGCGRYNGDYELEPSSIDKKSYDTNSRPRPVLSFSLNEGEKVSSNRESLSRESVIEQRIDMRTMSQISS